MNEKIKVTVEIEGMPGQFVEYIAGGCSCPLSQAMANVKSKLAKENGRSSYSLLTRAW